MLTFNKFYPRLILIPARLHIILFLLLVFSFHSQAQTDQHYYQQLNNSLAEARKTRDQNALADIYFKLAEYEKEKNINNSLSFEYYTRSSEYYKLVEDTLNYHRAQWKIADHFEKNKNFDAAVAIYEDISRWYFEKDSILLYANVNIDLAKLYADNNETEKQNHVLRDLDAINDDLQDPRIKFEVQLQRIKQYYIEGRVEKSLEAAFNIFNESDSLMIDYYKGKSLFHIGYSNHILEDHDRAVTYLSKSLEFVPYEALDEERMTTYEVLSKSHSMQDNFQEALGYSNAYSALRDSILSKERLESINDITYKYESRKKTTEIKLLEKEKEFAESKNEQQKRIMYTLLFAMGLLLLAIYYIVGFYKQKMKANRIINSQRGEISHRKIQDLENKIKINSMQSMIEGQEQERERIARDLHDSLGGLLSTIKLQFGSVENKIENIQKEESYKKANELIDTAVKEVRVISQNLQPGALHDLGLISAITDLVNRAQSSNGPDIDFQHYDIPKKMDSMVALNIYRIIQELLNNAIKYASASEILIQLNKEEDDIVILFEDDGIGFDVETSQEKGMGMENIQSRVNYLKGNFHVDSRHEEGTSYMIHIKSEPEA